MTCLDRNNYDRAKCSDFFQVYRDCKKAWVSECPFTPTSHSFFFGVDRSNNEIRTGRREYINILSQLYRYA